MRHNPTQPRSWRSRSDRGSLSVEIALFAPVVVLLIMLGLLAHHVASAQIGLQTAAHAAARAATVETTTATASAMASARWFVATVSRYAPDSYCAWASRSSASIE